MGKKQRVTIRNMTMPELVASSLGRRRRRLLSRRGRGRGRGIPWWRWRRAARRRRRRTARVLLDQSVDASLEARGSTTRRGRRRRRTAWRRRETSRRRAHAGRRTIAVARIPIGLRAGGLMPGCRAGCAARWRGVTVASIAVAAIIVASAAIAFSVASPGGCPAAFARVAVLAPCAPRGRTTRRRARRRTALPGFRAV